MATTTSSERGGVSSAPRPHSLSATVSGATFSSNGVSSLPLRPTGSAGAGAGEAARFRASVDAAGMRVGGGPHAGTAAGVGAGAGWQHSTRGRPASDLLSVSHAAQQAMANVESDAIDRWFEDLQHYETTLEEMAAASLDANFKEELSAIEQWFRVLSEAERTAALYSLLQSSTQVQMRFFITVLQQMARSDPVTSLLSPANPSQQSMEAQMEAKLASLGLKSPASPVVRQFARQSLGDSYLSPYSANANTTTGKPGPPSPTAASSDDPNAAATLAHQRAKLKASARTSAPANLLLSTGIDSNKSSLWSDKETVVERRSPSPDARPRSTGSDHPAGTSSNVAQPNGAHVGLNLSHSTGPAATAAFSRSPALDVDVPQLSPMVGGSWASMVNTPLVPMFGGRPGTEPGSQMEPGNYGGHSPSLGSSSWSSNNHNNGGASPVLLDNDVRKFRRSARVGGGGSPSGGAIAGGSLSGMYDHRPTPLTGNNGNRGGSTFSSMQQNAINLGLGGLQHAQQQQQQQQSSPNPSGGGSRLNSSGALNSPGLLAAQQAAVAAQQNWRNGLGAGGNAGLGVGAAGLSPSLDSGEFGAHSAAHTNAQLANLLALQQQMIQQQQQMQALSNLAASGMGLSPVQMMQFQQQQAVLLSPGRGLGVGGSPMNLGMGLGMNGVSGARRSPRADRSPGAVSASSKAGNTTPNPSATPAGSGANPDEPLDMTLLGDVPSWLRSLRLHKYTPNFETSNWKEMVMLDDHGLELKGVAALGARRKLLKVFETVRIKMGMALPGDGLSSLNVDDAGSVRSVSPNGGSPNPNA